jgi:hypothetical protein
VIVNVYLPLLTLTLGYAQVEGMWAEIGRPLSQPFKLGRAPRTAWTKEPVPLPRSWKTEKP